MPFDGRILNGIGVLGAVVETRSFARASKALGLTPSGVSRAIARLEERLGVRLLQRTARSVTLTDEGRRFYESVRPLMQGIEDAADEAAGSTALAKGTLRVAVDSLRLTRRIVAQPALARYGPVEWKPGAQYQSDEDLVRLVGDIATTIFHPVGTTKMGADGDPMAVLDARLKVRGVEGLRVVDAGAMPIITSGNTNSPTLMMAEKAAAWIGA